MQLTPVQSQVLAGLLAGQPIAAVAREHGIHRSTIYHWRHQHPHFTFALDQARSRLQTALYDQVQDLTSQALEVLGELLRSEEGNIRLRVAQTLLRIANPIRAHRDLHFDLGIEALSDHLAGNQAIRSLAADVPQPPGPPESGTIRHFSTVEMPHLTNTRRNPGRNRPCPCNSGIKYKKCCGNPARPAASAAATAPGL